MYLIGLSRPIRFKREAHDAVYFICSCGALAFGHEDRLGQGVSGRDASCVQLTTALSRKPGAPKALSSSRKNPERDFAIIDFNVGGRGAISKGEKLDERGVSLIFSSGYVTAVLPERLHRCPYAAEAIHNRAARRGD